ncbi:RHS repeat domain-containing protein [Cohnella sp. GCM10012308]|uniref:RHS repeat domain-containing protein n=1 Tax=Cohnella sp. GCM10012308 TaxID=3317329 RepID=UPI00360CFAAC
MKRILEKLKLALGVLLFFSVGSQAAYADTASEVAGALNSLVVPKVVNETNKPFLADRYQMEETIDPQSGSLTIKKTDISLPGRDGLDLNIGRIYNSSQAEAGSKFAEGRVTAYQSCTDTVCQPPVYSWTIMNLLNPKTELNSRFNLGSGWSFSFPYIENNIYHDGFGASYEFTSDGILKDYPNKDAKITFDYSYDNGQSEQFGRSYYLFTDENLKKYYFSSYGNLMGVKDKNGNEIIFTYQKRPGYDLQYNFPYQITDTVGRLVTFNYENTLDGNVNALENITVSVQDPAKTSSYAVQYTKTGDTINYRNSPKLWRVTEAYNTVQATSTYYEYSLQESHFDFTHKQLEFPYGNWETSTYLLLKTIQYNNSKTQFDYEKVTRNLGTSGAYYAYRIKSRVDIQNALIPEETNLITYDYTNDFSGFPDYTNSDNLPETYIYTSESKQINNLKKKSTFNGKRQPTRTETTASNGERNIVINSAFDPNFKYSPTTTEYEIYNSSNVAGEKLYQANTYTSWGPVASTTLQLPTALYSNATTKEKYTTRFEYHPTYHWLTKASNWSSLTDANATVQTYSYYDNLNNDGVGRFGRLKAATNANADTVNYSYTLNATNQVQTTIQSQVIENGKNAKLETDYGASAGYAYPTEIRNFYTDKNNISTFSKDIYSYDMLLGLIKSAKDNALNETVYKYDALGRVTSTLQPAYTGQDGIKYQLEQLNEYTPQINVNFNGVRSAFRVYSYVKAINKTTNVTSISQQRNQYYNTYGQLLGQNVLDTELAKWINEKQVQYDNQSRPVKVIDDLNNTNIYYYGPWDEVVQIEDEFGNRYITQNDILQRKQTTFFVDKANLNTYTTNVAQQENRLETYSDVWGNTTSRKAYPIWPDTSEIVQESYVYDIVGNLVNYTDPNGSGYSYLYDKLKQLTEVTDPLMQKTSYTYTKLGQLKTNQQKDGNNTWVTEKQYDETGTLNQAFDLTLQGTTATTKSSYVRSPLGNIEQKTDALGTVFSYFYDELNNLKTATAGNYTQKTYYNENPFGPQKREELINNAMVRKTAYSYTALGLLKTKQYTGEDNYAQSTTRQYDTLNRLTQIKNDQTAFATNYLYNKTQLQKVQTDGAIAANINDTSKNAVYEYYANGTLKQITYPTLSNGVVLKTVYVYDGLKRLKQLTNFKGPQILSEYVYTYDGNGNIKTIKDSTGTTTYTYDKLNRLETIWRPDGSQYIYTYDGLGNRLTSSNTDVLNDNSANSTYNYDVWNRLTSATLGSNTVNFTYEPDGLRAKKTTGTGTTRYTYNDDGQVIAEANASNQVTSQYVWGPDRLLTRKDTNGSQYYYLYNGHGDVVQIIDNTGEPVKSYRYDEWGNTVSQTGTLPNVFKYAGEIEDPETGLYYLRARFYDPSMGRFITKDTYEGQIDNPLSLNLYTYVGNNPLTHVDPSGNDAIVINAPTSAAGYGHTSALVQNSKGEWAYYYYGDKAVVMIPITDPKVLINLKNLNDWLNGLDKDGNFSPIYEHSVYIEGDFNESYEIFSAMAKKYEADFQAGDNGDYSLFKCNCNTTTISGLASGKLSIGMSFAEYFGKGGIVPNTTYVDLVNKFHNRAYTHEQYEAQLAANYKAQSNIMKKYENNKRNGKYANANRNFLQIKRLMEH